MSVRPAGSGAPPRSGMISVVVEPMSMRRAGSPSAYRQANSARASQFDAAAVSTRSLVSMLFLIFGGSIVAFSAYVWLLRVSTPAKVATYAYVNPVVALLLGVTLGNETLGPRTVLASVVILGAVVIITMERKR